MNPKTMLTNKSISRMIDKKASEDFKKGDSTAFFFNAERWKASISKRYDLSEVTLKNRDIENEYNSSFETQRFISINL